MENIQALLQQVLKTYLVEKSVSRIVSKTSNSYEIVVNQLPKIFSEIGNIPNEIIIKGSIGKGVITYIPWICFFDRDITTSAQHGYYVCILFREDMKGFYLSLNQGWTQYEKQFGVKTGREEISLNSIKARSILRSTKNFEADTLDLKASTDLCKGYERGNIYSRYYSADALPSDKKIIDDLQQLLGAYRELKGLVGENILNIRTLSSEEDFQQEAQKSKEIELPAGPVTRPEIKTKSTASTSWPRSPRVARVALDNANHTCEYDKDHITFISSASGNTYVEVHHLVPMEKQNAFDVSLDVPENIVALCPNCHRRIHLSSQADKSPMLELLFNLRSKGLESRGIKVSLSELNNIYRNTEII